LALLYDLCFVSGHNAGAVDTTVRVWHQSACVTSPTYIPVSVSL